MVKGVARPAGSSVPSTTGAPQNQQQSLPSMQAGQNPHDPLTQLNSHLGFGALAGFNPFPDMGVNPNDPNMVRTDLYSLLGPPSTVAMDSYVPRIAHIYMT